MKKIIEYKREDGSSIFIESEDNVPTEVMRSSRASSLTETASEKFENAIKPLKDISNDLIECIQQIAKAPSEVVVEMGLKFSAKAGIIITSVDSEANLKVSIKWSKT